MCFRWRGFWLNYAIRADQTDLNIGRGFSYPAFVCSNTPTQMCVCYCCKQHLFSEDSSKSQERECSLWKKGVALKFYDEREGKLFSPAFCLFSEGLLTSMAGLVMASLWIHGVHRAAGSGPGRATGCLAFSGHGLWHLLMLTEFLTFSCPPAYLRWLGGWCGVYKQCG